jgi:gamma-glutamyltranspeptidase/glutathione hydrolase
MIGFPATAANTTSNWPRRRAWPLYTEQGMVGAAHPLTAEAGLELLRAGGNAVDAAVGAGLVAAVVMPEMCGLGGDLFAVLHIPGADGADGQIVSVQGSGISPRQAPIELMRDNGSADGQMPYQGPLSISVPGMVDAYHELLARFGTMSFAQVSERAIALARYGFPLQPLGAAAIASCVDLLRQDEAAAAVFLAGGETPQAGDILQQSDLADTIEAIGNADPRDFYSGDLAQRMVSYLNSVGSPFTMEDFADHTTDIGTPYATTYRNYAVYQTAIPSQGLILLEALNIVEQADLSDPFSPAAIHTMVEAKKLAYADRLRHAADANFHATPLETILGKPWAAERFTHIDPARASTSVDGGPLTDGDTTYLNIIDDAGMMISLIQSVSSAFGSGVIGGDTGVLFNNRVGRGFTLQEGHVNQYAPGKKTMHTLNCYLVADAAGRPVLVGGTPGGDGQPQWNLQALVSMIDAGLDAQAAIDAPRWTSWPGTDPSVVANPYELWIEDRIGPDAIDALRNLGHTVKVLDPWDGGGSMQIIARNPESGLLIGGTDARVEGNVLGY